MGVSDPKRPTAKEIKTILDAYIHQKKLDIHSFEIYTRLINSSLKTIFEGFTNFSKDETLITSCTIDVIKQVLDILREELCRDLSSEERKQIIDRVFDLVKESREESRESRQHKVKIIGSVVTCIVVVVGGVYTFLKGSDA